MPYVEIHPKDAAKLGVRSGDIVELYNEEGNETCVAYMSDAPKPGTLFAIMYHPRGTANSLTSPYTDPLSVNPWYKGTRAGLRKLGGAIPDILRTTSFRQTNNFG